MHGESMQRLTAGTSALRRDGARGTAGRRGVVARAADNKYAGYTPKKAFFFPGQGAQVCAAPGPQTAPPARGPFQL